jgi:hypothetical protein
LKKGSTVLQPIKVEEAMEEGEVVEEDEDGEDGGDTRDQDLPVASREIRKSVVNELPWEVPVTRLNNFQLPNNTIFAKM